MRFLRMGLFVVGLILIVPTVLVHLDNRESRAARTPLNVPAAVQRPLAAMMLAGSILPASLLWSIGVNRWIVAAGGDVAYFTPLGIVLLYWSYPVTYWFFRSTAAGKRLETWLERRFDRG